jgi:hypothetical protein
MEKTIECRMCDLPRLWDEIEGRKYFTVGRGKAQYELWTCGQSGLHYAYRTGPDGYAEGRRAIEPIATVVLHYNN